MEDTPSGRQQGGALPRPAMPPAQTSALRHSILQHLNWGDNIDMPNINTVGHGTSWATVDICSQIECYGGLGRTYFRLCAYYLTPIGLPLAADMCSSLYYFEVSDEHVLVWSYDDTVD